MRPHRHCLSVVLPLPFAAKAVPFLVVLQLALHPTLVIVNVANIDYHQL